jgi:hypothetical protein
VPDYFKTYLSSTNIYYWFDDQEASIVDKLCATLLKLGLMDECIESSSILMGISWVSFEYPNKLKKCLGKLIYKGYLKEEAYYKILETNELRDFNFHLQFHQSIQVLKPHQQTCRNLF